MAAVKYHNIPTSDRDVDIESNVPKSIEEEHVIKPNFVLRLATHVLTLCSYTVFFCLFPITYWVCVKRVKKTERVIIFRLGALIGSRGPGRVIIFPWIDRTETVEVSNSAFSVPPQQLITHDGGIIEIGAEIHYAVTDCVALVREVANHQEMIRSLAKTVVVRIIIKKTIQQLTKDKKAPAKEVKTEINGQVRKWGLDIRAVILSDVKVLKAPEKEGGIPPLLASLGHSTQSLSPAEFAKYVYAADEAAREADVEDNSSTVEEAEQGKLSWCKCLETLLEAEKLDEESLGKYIIHLTDNNNLIILDINTTSRICKEIESAVPVDVTVALSSSDLAGILKGSLPPLQAYLTNRINVSGDVRKLMLLEKLSSKQHKPGQKFDI